MDKKTILEELEAEEERIKNILADNSDDFEELQSEWQERDSPAERNLREVEWNQYKNLQQVLVEINDAKERLANDTYGFCEDCRKHISEKRLSNVLTARKCIRCQENFEKQAGTFGQHASL